VFKVHAYGQFYVGRKELHGSLRSSRPKHVERTIIIRDNRTPNLP